MSEFSVKNFFQKHQGDLYKLLQDTLGSKLPNLPALSSDDLVPLKWEEIGDGNINFIFRVWLGRDEKSAVTVVVKYASTYIRCLGPAYLLTQERLELEYKAMCQYHKLRPFCVPTPVLYDKEFSAIVMEDLTGYQVMRSNIVKGVVDLRAINEVMVAIATTHRMTVQEVLGSAEHQKLCEVFKNTAMVSITDQYIFTKPYLNDDETNKHHPLLNEEVTKLRADKEACQRAAKMRKIFLEYHQCLCHGDLHTGSVMNKESDAKMFDIEFVFMGPASFDFGMFLANIIFAIIRHHHLKNLSIVEILWTSLTEAIKSYYNAETSNLICGTDDFNTMTYGFIGCELIRRVIGAAHVEDLSSIPEGELMSLQLGREFLFLDSLKSDKDMTNVITTILKKRRL